MRSSDEIVLKKTRRGAIFLNQADRHIVLFLGMEKKGMYPGNFSSQHFVRASDQKTPALREKSRAALVHLDVCEAHPVSMLFSGAGVPLIGMFQGVASFISRWEIQQ